MNTTMDSNALTGLEIAIIGLAGRFPGARDVDELWRNLRDGVESVTRFDDETLRERGVDEALLADPAYVKAGIELDGVDQFDAGFFGYSPRDAERLDPQQRLFLETAWQALEHAGHAGQAGAATAVYAGSGANVYLMRHLLPSVSLAGTQDVAALLGLLNGNDKDSLATRVAYKMDLRGPAVSVQTACSTSLVAVHLACRSLLNHEADMALAGGVWLNLMQEGGYLHQAGAILSPDGHCRAFDARASGTVLGSGAGAVVLKRLADALADGDTIHAVIKGSALNNDGAAKVGYTAPSVEGQAAVIRAAHAFADVDAASIGYVEAHGTGTTLGDPIEVAALNQAFGASTSRRGYCALGSVKTNIGHLDAAAGVTGLIKAVMALRHRTLPPSLNFEQPNPNIDFAQGPFYVNTVAKDWPEGATPRRAGVSSFGMGGTNVHVVLEEAPVVARPGQAAHTDTRVWPLLLSARSASALANSARRLAAHLRAHPELALADVASTLALGRKRFDHRAVVMASTLADAADALDDPADACHVSGEVLSDRPVIAFMFPGQGTQHVDMGRALYEGEPVFKAVVDQCSETLAPRLGCDLRDLLYPDAAQAAQAQARLEQTEITQPALFVVEYAMARLWMSWGVQPEAMVGHSIGEYVAACLAGVFSLAEALEIVAARGRLLQTTRPGAMLAVNLPAAEAQSYASGRQSCDLAAINAADLCVLSGAPEAIDMAERDLAGRGVAVRRLHVSHAFHSSLVAPMLDEFHALLSRITLRAPSVPFVSNLSGTWITSDEACSPAYWVRHVRGTVRFADGLATLLERPDRILLEVGPGDTLSGLARRHPLAKGRRAILSTQCHPRQAAQQSMQPVRSLAKLWLAGVTPLDAAWLGEGVRRRVPLPTYPFERQSYWVPPPSSPVTAARSVEAASAPRRSDVGDWFHVPSWRRTEMPQGQADEGAVLLLADEGSLSMCLHRALTQAGRPVVWLTRGQHLVRHSSERYTVHAGDSQALASVLTQVKAEVGPIGHVCHLWALSPAGRLPDSDEALASSVHSLMALAQAMDLAGWLDQSVSLTVLVNQVEDVHGDELLSPEKATLHGPCVVIPQEYPAVRCRVVDVASRADDPADDERIVGQLLAEMQSQSDERVVAYRGTHRWAKHFDTVRRDAPMANRLRERGVYLITGGLGGVGLVLARHLASKYRARLVLLGRTVLPDRNQWRELVAQRQDPALSDKLAQVLALEALGAQVLTLSADVADAAGMRHAIDAAYRHFGGLHGVIHAAGESGGGLIGGRRQEDAQRVLAAKVTGTQALVAALASVKASPSAPPLDFMVLCSSLASVAGGLGKADYAAANAYLDALATVMMRRAGMTVFAIGWDGWRDVGMASGVRLPDHVGIAADQGTIVFERVVSGPASPHTVVSTTPLAERLARLDEGVLSAMAAAAGGAPARSGHPRPDLATPYVAPEGELDVALASIWSELLGITPIGMDDNLFELGGDSLLAIQVLARVRGLYGVAVHPSALFKTPTLASLAVLVETSLIDDIENADLAAEAPDRATATA